MPPADDDMPPSSALPPPALAREVPGDSNIADWGWLHGQIAALWAALQSIRPGHTDEQLRAVVSAVVSVEVHKAVKEEVAAAMREVTSDLTALHRLIPDLSEMVEYRHRREAAEERSEAMWADWRARISKTVGSLPQFFGMLAVLLTMSQLNRQGLVSNQLFWAVVVLIGLWGLWTVYATLLRPARAPRSRRPPGAAPGSEERN